ncbi:hypothetical protein EYV94_20165 [Puteibacter caeruleilacunae]|nr:hypothetical protein EYV94_20165 [Puteibacter caeruleilacunae]
MASCTSTQAPQQPNIIYILADDLGYGDVSCLNQESKIHTPHIDRLASQGISFTEAHTNAAVCTPTRYGILTGRYAWRSRLKSHVLVGHEPALIEQGRETLGSLLKSNGYHTACIGKWHLGLNWQKKDSTKALFEGGLWNMTSTDNVDYAAHVGGGPSDYGFDYEYVLPASLDIAPYVYVENGKVTAAVERQVETWQQEDRGLFYRHGDVANDFDHNKVLEHITTKAVTYINKQVGQEEPFFLYFPMTAPHTPWLPADEYKGKSKAGAYGDFVTMVDAMVGRVLKSIDDAGIAENTIVVFTSDNGSDQTDEEITRFQHEANIGRRGRKGDIWDGGHHVPFMVRWPQKIKAGSTVDATISTTDWFATCAEITGVELKDNAGEDSYSLLSLLTGECVKHEIREATVFHSAAGKFAIRRGMWKYVDLPDKSSDPILKGQLYNMEEDQLETKNVFLENEDVARELKELLEQYKTAGRSRPINIEN